MIENYPKRLIEVDLPIKRISIYAKQEKDMRKSHVPQMYIYPATRPTSVCRAVICASLWFDPADELCPKEFREIVKMTMLEFAEHNIGSLSHKSYQNFNRIAKNPEELNDNLVLRALLLDFIADFADWDNSTNEDFLETARFLTHTAHLCLTRDTEFLEAFAKDSSLEKLKAKIANSPKSLVVDPFAGGGAIPLEALRVGADAYASDLNPVAVLQNKVVLEYIPRYGSRLAEEILKWGDWIKVEADKELAEFYPKDGDGSTPIAYLWARTIVCEGPACGAEIPLMRTLWLAKKGKNLIAMRFIVDKAKKQIDFDIIKQENKKWISEKTGEEVINPKFEGTVKRFNATCPVCNFTTSVKSVRKQLRKLNGGANDARLYCVVSINSKVQGRIYRLPIELDFESLQKAKEEVTKRIAKHKDVLSLIPDETLPLMSGVFNAPIYGHNTWGSLFTHRQSLALITYSKFVNKYCEEFLEKEKDFAVAFSSVAGFIVNRLADLNASLCAWQLSTPNTAHVFVRWALQMIMDFGEVNPLAGAGGSPESAIRRMVRGIKNIESANLSSGIVTQTTAVNSQLPDDSSHLFFTDPPYYNAIPYADLSDFFYVWLRRTLKNVHPSLFSSQLTPKEDEITEMAGWDAERYAHKDKKFFELEMAKALAEQRRVLSPDGIGVVVFAHKSTAGWEALLQAMVDAGWIITASWAIDTEMESRLRAKNSAALASSVHLVCRPRENSDGSLQTNTVGEWSKILQELPQRIHEWMPRLREEGIVGADAIFACLGPALEIFSRYERVEKSSGEVVPLRVYLESVWAAVSKEALQMIFAGADASGFEPDARLTAMWLWTLSTAQSNTDLESRIINALNPNEEVDDDEEESSGKAKIAGFSLEFDTARKIAQGMGINLEELRGTVEIKGEMARLLAVKERSNVLFGNTNETAAAKTATRKKNLQQSLFAEAEETTETTVGGWHFADESRKGETVLDRLHQAMLFFAANRNEALKRFLVEDGVGQDERFWRLANALSALYPSNSEEKRWVDGILARKKGLGF